MLEKIRQEPLTQRIEQTLEESQVKFSEGFLE